MQVVGEFMLLGGIYNDGAVFWTRQTSLALDDDVGGAMLAPAASMLRRSHADVSYYFR
jgi:hypothetical protein